MDESFVDKKEKNKIFIVAIVLLVILVLGLCGYILYGIIFNNKIEEEKKTIVETEKQEEVVENYNYTEISNVLNDKLAGFLAYRGFDKNGTDLLSITDLRLELVNYLLMDDANKIYDGQGRSVSYDAYNSKYIELYGEEYSLENDLLNVSSGAIAEKNTTDNTISWNGVWGTSSLTYNLTAQNIVNDNDIYTLTGTYTVTSVNDGSNNNGTFTIKYTQKDNIKNIQSIILTEAN